MISILTKDLIGKPLDYAVAKIGNPRLSAKALLDLLKGGTDGIGNCHEPFAPSTDGSQCMQIIEEGGISIIRCDDDYTTDRQGYVTDRSKRIPVWCACLGQRRSETSTGHQSHDAMFQVYESTVVYGPTARVAAMRAHVASRLGNAVEIPDELCRAS